MARRKIVGEDGRVYREEKRGGCLKWVLIAIVLLVVAGYLGKDILPTDPTNNDKAVTNNSLPSIKQQEETTKEKDPDPEIEATATEIITTFNNNELKGKEMYTGKLAKITGKVGSVGETFGMVYVTLTSDSNGFEIVSLQCYFEEENQVGLSDLSEGDYITIIGTIGEKSMNIEVDDCKLVNE